MGQRGRIHGMPNRPTPQPTPRIRATRIDDLALLPAVERSAGDAFRTIPNLAWIADDSVMSAAQHQQLLSGGWCRVALVGREVAGFVTAQQFDTQLHIWELAVRAESQGQGLGRALLQALIDEAEAAAMAAVTLTTFVDVPWNAPFYRKLGFAVLEPTDLGSRLKDCLAAEAAAGLPMAQRCAMSLRLAAATG